MDINRFAKLKAAAKVPRRSSAIIGKNQQLWDLGTTYIEMEDPGTVEDKITKFDFEFDLVMIAEYFDESLVLLAQLLCWELTEVRSVMIHCRPRILKN